MEVVLIADNGSSSQVSVIECDSIEDVKAFINNRHEKLKATQMFKDSEWTVLEDNKYHYKTLVTVKNSCYTETLSAYFNFTSDLHGSKI